MSADNVIALPIRDDAESELRQRLTGALVHIENLETENRALRNQVAQLKRDLKKHTRSDLAEHANYEVACQLFKFWQVECGHPRSMLSPERLKPLIARLEHHEPREIAKAIRGAKYGAYVDDRGVKHDDLELICRNEQTFDRFRARYEAATREGQGQ